MSSKLVLVFGDDLEAMRKKAEQIRATGFRANLRSLTYWQNDVESQASEIVIVSSEDTDPARIEAVVKAYGARVRKDDSEAKAKAEAEAKAKAEAEAKAKAPAPGAK